MKTKEWIAIVIVVIVVAVLASLITANLTGYATSAEIGVYSIPLKDVLMWSQIQKRIDGVVKPVWD